MCIRDRYRVILLPEFKSKGMVESMAERGWHKTARKMATWSPFKFKQRLLAQAHHKGVKVLTVREDFTTKACTRCGFHQDTWCNNREFHCPHCDGQWHRDLNGARNIWLRAAQYWMANFDEAQAQEGSPLDVHVNHKMKYNFFIPPHQMR